jgi:hypothetical protein
MENIYVQGKEPIRQVNQYREDISLLGKKASDYTHKLNHPHCSLNRTSALYDAIQM